jgi:hypothetical protein
MVRQKYFSVAADWNRFTSIRSQRVENRAVGDFHRFLIEFAEDEANPELVHMPRRFGTHLTGQASPSSCCAFTSTYHRRECRSLRAAYTGFSP